MVFFELLVVYGFMVYATTSEDCSEAFFDQLFD